MGQKIHPLGFRLGITQKHRSQWFSKIKHYSGALLEDYIIRKYLTEELKVGGDAGLSKIHLIRRTNRIFIEAHVAQPKIVTGENGVRLKELTSTLQKKLAGSLSLQESRETIPSISFQVIQVAQPATDATLLAQRVAQQLEKRVAFRRVMKQTVQQAREAGVEGIKIQIAGRLNGAEIARTEWVREGRVPLHTLRADIDYCAYPAQTIYGLLGIKIWIYKGLVI